MPNVLHLAAAAALLLQVAPMPAFAAETTTGSWEVRAEPLARKLDFDVRFSDGAGSSDESTIDIDTTAFGLTPERFAATNGDVTLAFKRESGSFDGKGTIADSTGGGTFAFTPSETFVTAMHDRGYDLTGHDCFRAAMLGLTTSYIDDLGKLGYHNLELHQLWAFRALGVDEDFIRSMQTAFHKDDLPAHELTSLRALGVTAAYVTSMRVSGFSIDEPEDAIKFKALGVNEDYVRELSKAGYSNLSANDVVKLRALGIDGRYVERVESHGFPHPTVEQLVKLKAMNVVYASCTTVLV